MNCRPGARAFRSWLRTLQEKKRKQESERRKNLGGVFALSADDFDKATFSSAVSCAWRLLERRRRRTSEPSGHRSRERERERALWEGPDMGRTRGSAALPSFRLSFGFVQAAQEEARSEKQRRPQRVQASAVASAGLKSLKSESRVRGSSVIPRRGPPRALECKEPEKLAMRCRKVGPDKAER